MKNAIDRNHDKSINKERERVGNHGENRNY